MATPVCAASLYREVRTACSGLSAARKRSCICAIQPSTAPSGTSGMASSEEVIHLEHQKTRCSARSSNSSGRFV